ncbi:DNA polymerase II large subunit, partial [Candidatus Pacearchaeota archaeon]|nr:DNA polymerase II large subunit [Candidatus Pacearchaeota archaeon]
GFAYITIAVVASPLEGYTELKIEKTRDGKEYFKVYFSGPIRSAGTTASCVVLMLIDYLRETFGFAKYDPTEEEIKRYVTENRDYHERITNLQYFPLEEEMIFLAEHLPIQIAGEPTAKLEVSNYKNLDRVETDRIRGGMCLIFSEGLAQKAAKGYRLLKHAKENGIKSTGFDFLEEYIELHEKLSISGKKESGSERPTYIRDLVAGRPVFGHPSWSGGFRFRYGRSRVDGFSAASLHPATMAVTDDFIAIGTQLKVEKPTKGCAIASCDSIEGPIVKMKSGTVRKLNDEEKVKELYSDIEEVIYLGDILFPFSDLANRNYNLIKPGYVQEWWKLDLRERDAEAEKKIDCFDVGFEKAIELSEEKSVPLHPDYIFYWSQISMEQFLGLVDWLKNARATKKIIFPYNKTEQEKFKLGKRALELLGVEHDVSIENVIVNEKNSQALFANLGLDLNLLNIEEKNLNEVLDKRHFQMGNSVLEAVNIVSNFEIKDKAGEFIGTRMGRPEKAKLRKLTGSPNVLFPVGNEGGRLRSVQAACEAGKVWGGFPLKHCEKCDKETIYRKCERCGEKTKQKYYFHETKEKSLDKEAKWGDKEGLPYQRREIDINHYLGSAVDLLEMNDNEVPLLIKGVRGLSSGDKQMEHLAKGILRAKYDLQVNKDGSIRFDATELPLNSFKPKEIGTSVEKLIELGYSKDINGKKLKNENQILQLKPHDVLLPSCPDSPDEKADDVFVRVAEFVDEELETFYNMKPFYKIKTREEIIGHLGVCMAPHNCAGVICRFIGFSKTQGLMASPFMHAAIRRDCDGDEAALMLLGDVLINFSRKFLPSHRGGTQDAPLVLNAKINAGEVDDQILDFEYVPNKEYPHELYKLAEKGEHSSKVKSITMCKDVFNNNKNPFIKIGFTHDTTDFNQGVTCSAYKKLGKMQEKVLHQMELVEKLRAADTADTAKLIIERHFIRDMRGNLRKFSMQGFRCVSCNESFRRPPLKGKCPKCNGKIIFTIHEGGIKKYLEPALELSEKYNLSKYLKQSLQMTKEYIDSVFGKELEKQESIDKWF